MIDVTTAAPGRGRGMVAGVLLGLAAASWAYLWLVTTQMGDMSSVFAMPMTSAWSSGQTGLMIAMWVVMMVAMMLPSAVPMVVTYDRMDRRSVAGTGGSTAIFVAGYIVVWSAFAVMATALQWVLLSAALVDGTGEATHGGLAGSLLIGAGIFQFSPIKRRSLGACRTPMGFLTTSWRNGAAGAFRMGVHHGTLCLRCCWALMIVLFALGVMNQIWVILLAVFVLAEKMTRRGEAISAIGGVVMIVWGLATVVVGG
ncbi:MAG: DUF2182 domain-containing protein [Actinomycetota bacterium]